MAPNPLVSLIGRLLARSGRKRGNRQMDGRTEWQNNYCNPRCAYAPMVNNRLLSNGYHFCITSSQLELYMDMRHRSKVTEQCYITNNIISTICITQQSSICTCISITQAVSHYRMQPQLYTNMCTGTDYHVLHVHWTQYFSWGYSPTSPTTYYYTCTSIAVNTTLWHIPLLASSASPPPRGIKESRSEWVYRSIHNNHTMHAWLCHSTCRKYSD